MIKGKLLLMALLFVGLAIGCDDDTPNLEASADGVQEEGVQEEGVQEEGDEAATESVESNSAEANGESGAEQEGDEAQARESAFAYPDFDLSALNDRQRSELAGLAMDELCPCADAVVSLHECMQEAERCEEADEMAATMTRALLEGAASQEAQEQLVRDRRANEGGHDFTLEGAPVKGNPDADVVIVEFADFLCPHCRIAAAALDEVVKEHGDEIAVYFKSFPLGSPMSDVTARAAYAAHRQGRFWPMHDLIFANQTSLSDAKIDAFARQIGLNFERFKRDMETSAVRAAVLGSKQEGLAAGVQGTPAIFVNGQRYSGGLTDRDIAALIARER